VCVCVCVCARARVCVNVCVRERQCVRARIVGTRWVREGERGSWRGDAKGVMGEALGSSTCVCVCVCVCVRERETHASNNIAPRHEFVHQWITKKKKKSQKRYPRLHALDAATT
jgi:hypothetical protein